MRKLVLIVLAVLFVIPACGGKEKVAIKTPEPVVSQSPCPDWYTNLPQDPDFYLAASTALSKDLQTAVEKAKTDARAEIGRTMQSHMEGLTKRFTDEVGLAPESKLMEHFSQTVDIVLDQELKGSKVRLQHTVKEGDVWRACVLMECSRVNADEALIDNISKDEEMYTRFRATEAYKEMEYKVKAAREYKKEQSGQ